MSGVYANVEMFTTIAVLGMASTLAAVSLVSYVRMRLTRALLVGAGFLAFAAKGAYLTARSWETRGADEWLLPVAVFDFVILVLLYLALRVPQA